MKAGWRWWMAARYLVARRKEKKSILSVLAVLGLSLGVATLITVLGVMNGFQGGTIRLLRDLQSFHVRLEPEAGAQDGFDLTEALGMVRGNPLVASVAEVADAQVLVRSSLSSPAVVQVRGLDQEELDRMGELFPEFRLMRGSDRLDDPRGIILGAWVARQLGLRVGDELQVVHLGGDGGAVEEMSLLVQGIVTFGAYPFDSAWALAPLDGDLRGVFALDRYIGVRLRHPEQDQALVQDLRREALGGVRISRWRDYNRAMFGALRVEKMLMTITVGLMFLVVAVNLYHDMRVSVREKMLDLGVLLAMGARKRDIGHLFMLQGLILGGLGGLFGGILGTVLAANLEALSAFFTQAASAILGRGLGTIATLPVEVRPAESMLVILSALVSGWGSAWLATRGLRRLEPAEIIRQS